MNKKQEEAQDAYYNARCEMDTKIEFVSRAIRSYYEPTLKRLWNIYIKDL